MIYNKQATIWRLLSHAAVLLATLIPIPLYPALSVAESYNQWLATGASAPSVFNIEKTQTPASPRLTPISDYRRGYGGFGSTSGQQLPMRPPGGAVAKLRFISPPTNRLPLTLRLIATEVEVDDLLATPNRGTFNVWSQDAELLDRNAQIRRAIYEEDIRLTTVPSDAFVLRLPEHSRFQYGSPGLFSFRVEVLDNQGQVMSRALPVPAYSAQPNQSVQAWVGQDSAVERYFRDVLHLSTFATLQALPNDIVALNEMPNIGLTADLVDGGSLSAKVVREAILAGTHFFGPQEVIRDFATSAAVPPNARAALGKLRPIGTDTAGDLSNAQQYEYYTPVNLSDVYNSWTQLGSTSTPGIFSSYRRTYVRWTTGLLTIFSLVLIIGIPGCFFYLPPSRRIHVWWAVPALALTISLLSVVIASAALPRSPLIQTVEYRFAHTAWKEVYHHAAARFLDFRDEELGFRAPAGAQNVAANIQNYGSANTPSLRITRTPEQTLINVRNKSRGRTHVVETTFYDEHTPPVEIETKDHTVLLRAKSDIRTGYYVTRDAIRRIDSLPRDTTIRPSQIKTETAIEGLGHPLLTYFQLEPSYSVPESHRLRHFVFDRVAMGTDDFLLFLSTTEQPGIEVINQSAVVSSQVIWILQGGGLTPPSENS